MHRLRIVLPAPYGSRARRSQRPILRSIFSASALTPPSSVISVLWSAVSGWVRSGAVRPSAPPATTRAIARPSAPAESFRTLRRLSLLGSRGRVARAERRVVRAGRGPDLLLADVLRV